MDVKSSMDDLRMAIGKSTASLGLSLANILQNSFEADKAYEATRQIAFRLTTAAAAAKEALMKKNKKKFKKKILNISIYIMYI